MPSRVETILQAIVDGTPASQMAHPQSRNEELLIEILDKVNTLAEQSIVHICVSGEYDPVTGVPTVQNPEVNIFYLVPNGDSGSDMYEEWVWTGTTWEHVGAGGSIVIPQSDWAQNDSTAPDYIKNKPTVATGVSF